MSFFRFRTPEHFFFLGCLPLIIGTWFFFIYGTIRRLQLTKSPRNTLTIISSNVSVLCIPQHFEENYRQNREDVQSLGPFLTAVSLFAVYFVYRGFNRQPSTSTNTQNACFGHFCFCNLFTSLHHHAEKFLVIVANCSWRSFFGIVGVLIFVLGTALTLFSFAVIVSGNTCTWHHVSRIVGSTGLAVGLTIMLLVLRNVYTENRTSNPTNGEDTHTRRNTLSVVTSEGPVHTTVEFTCQATSHINVAVTTELTEDLPPLPSYEEAMPPSYEEAIRMPPRTLTTPS